jgi:hypothetical protein
MPGQESACLGSVIVDNRSQMKSPTYLIRDTKVLEAFLHFFGEILACVIFLEPMVELVVNCIGTVNWAHTLRSPM